MPIDTSIYRQPQQPSLMENMGQLLALRGMQQNQAAHLQQQEAGALQLEQQKRAMSEEDAYKAALAENNGDVRAALPKIMQVAPGHGLKVAKWLEDQDAAKLNQRKSQLEIEAKNHERMGSLAAAGAGSHEAALGAIQTMAKEGLITPEEAMAAYSTPPGLLLGKMQQLSQQAMTVAQQRAEERAKIEAGYKANDEAQKAVMRPLEAKKAEQAVTGTQPMTDYQKQQIEARQREKTPAELAYAANDPKATPGQRSQAQAALKTLEQHSLASRPVVNVGAGTGGAADQPKAIAEAIMRGEQPPDVKGLYRMAGPVRFELAKRGYDMMTAQADWQATQKHLATLNGPQQERLRQAITFTADSLDNIESLYAEWKKLAGVSGLKVINRANLAAMKQLPGRAGEVATNLEAQINDLTSELGTVYKGGNSSTDESLKLASGNLKAEWNDQTFGRAVQQIRKNLKIRQNSMLSSTPAGLSSAKGGDASAPESKVEKWGFDSSGKLVKQ